MRARLSGLVVGALIVGACGGGAPVHSIVPVPSSFERGSGTFVLDENTRIALADGGDAELLRVADLWVGPIRLATGLPLSLGASGQIRLSLDAAAGAEGYSLIVGEGDVSVTGGDYAGLFYGLQTLSQLLPPGVADGVAGHRGPFELGAAEIRDAPRFPYRGMHLDVGRHFFGPEFVKRYIDMLARYKINRFHWHLTEDQGWRIEIRRYPLLTQLSAFRAETIVEKNFDPYVGDGQRYGGFYTQEEIRDIVRYAADRFVTIIPEIEMPGHTLAVLAAYPELACTEGPFEVGTVWGVHSDIFCPSEETFEFLENVLTEVMALFPGEYIHIGGDEAPKVRWQESSFAQEVIRREGLADENELQSWFIRRIERFLNANGRRLIGWDEILEGGLAPNATVMSWRGTEGGIQAAQQGHDVVMTPTSHLYFDYYQSEEHDSEPLAIGGFLPLERVYEYEPIPSDLTDEQAVHILGAQGNVWTEYMKTEQYVEYMVFPRLFALSEVVWSPADAKDLDGFLDRLRWHLKRLDALGVNYRALDGR